MPFIGNQPAESYSAFQKQDFSTSATTSYTLDHPVANQNEIALFINFVRQEPTTAYTASGTSLTLTSATASSDDMYCIYLGKAVQTVNPPSGSVGSSQVAASIITGQTALGATPADTDELLISDAGTLKRVDYSYLKPTNTPNFSAVPSSSQTITSGVWTAVNFQTEIYDTASAYDGTNKFTVPTGEGGKYFFKANLSIDSVYDQDIIVGALYKNGNSDIGSENESVRTRHIAAKDNTTVTFNICGLVEASAGDYFQVYINHNRGSDRTLNSARCGFIGYKIIE